MSFGVQSTTTDPWATQQTAGTTSTSLRPFANLNLTEDQRTKIRSILQTARSNGTSKTDVQNQILAVLTPSQQATFQTNVQNAQSAGSGRHRHQGGDGDATSTTDGTSSATLANGLTQTDIQNAVLAAQSLLNQQNPAQTILG